MLLSRIPHKLCMPTLECVYHRLFNTCAIKRSHIFERDYELPDGPLYINKLEKKHNVYRVVGFQRGPPELEVILTKDSLEHGVAGEVIEVEKHVGRSLIRNFEAIYASPENLKEVASSFSHKLVVPESALELPKYTIESSDPDIWTTHDMKITVNGADTVTLKVMIVPWNRKDNKR